MLLYLSEDSRGVSLVEKVLLELWKQLKGSPRDSLASHFIKNASALSVLKYVCSTGTLLQKKSRLIISGCTFLTFALAINKKSPWGHPGLGLTRILMEWDPYLCRASCNKLPASFFFFSFSLNVANIAEVIAIDNYEPNQDLISQSAPCTSWLNLTRLNIKTWSTDKACLLAAGWGAGGSDPTFIFPETRWLCYSQVRLGFTGKR